MTAAVTFTVPDTKLWLFRYGLASAETEGVIPPASDVDELIYQVKFTFSDDSTFTTPAFRVNDPSTALVPEKMATAWGFPIGSFIKKIEGLVDSGASAIEIRLMLSAWVDTVAA